MAATGGVRLTQMIKDGKVDDTYLWLDAYNQATSYIAGTITTRIDASNHYSVTLETNTKYKNRMIAQINPKTRECRYFDIRKLTPRECLRLMGVPEEYINKMIGCKKLANSALYKLAGNSIVVPCLEALYHNIWYYQEADNKGWSEGELFPAPKWAYNRYRRRANEPAPEDWGRKALVTTLCSGYDAQCLALEELKKWCGADRQAANGDLLAAFDYDLIAWAEFDPESKRPLEVQPAVVAHNANFPQWADRNLGDMTQIDWDGFVEASEYRDIIRKEGIDLLTYSTPCQSISQAGKREGIAKDSGTRSAVLWYTEVAIKALRPKVLIQENVAALVNQENMPHFRAWQQTVAKLGYRNFWRVLNAKEIAAPDSEDGPVPQNRDRLFMVSVRNDIMPEAIYPFPEPQTLHRTIADVMEKDADQQYFLKPESVKAFLTKSETEKMIYFTTDHKLTEEELNEVIENEQNAA